MAIVDLSGGYNPATRRLGALDCNYRFPDDPNDRWCFNSFGAQPFPDKTLVSFDYKVAAGAEVRAATAGIVVAIELDERPQFYPGEFEIRTQSSPNSGYLVIYDHVRNPRVTLGSVVSPGDLLGIAGIHRGDPTLFGRVEIQVNFYPNPRDRRRPTHICPAVLGTDAFNQAQRAALAAHNAANPSFARPSICVVETIERR